MQDLTTEIKKLEIETLDNLVFALKMRDMFYKSINVRKFKNCNNFLKIMKS